VNVTLTIENVIIRPWSGLIDLIRFLEAFLLDHPCLPVRWGCHPRFGEALRRFWVNTCFQRMNGIYMII
jgi:hypothetical protein